MDEFTGPIWQILMEEARKKMPVLMDPTGGMDGGPNIPKPEQPPLVTPWALHVGGNETSLDLPANRGANFQAYVNYRFNPFSPEIVNFRGAGLRYRYQF